MNLQALKTKANAYTCHMDACYFFLYIKALAKLTRGRGS